MENKTTTINFDVIEVEKCSQDDDHWFGIQRVLQMHAYYALDLVFCFSNHWN